MTRAENKAIIGEQALEAEQEVLGAILLHNRLYDDVAGILRPEHFLHPAHGLIYSAVGASVARGEEANAATLRRHFEHAEALKAIGGAKYLGELMAGSVSPASVIDYARAVADAATARAASAIAAGLPALLENPPIGSTAGDVLQEAIGRLEGTLERGPVSSAMPVAQAIQEALAQAQAAMRGELKGMSTGLKALDGKLGGLQEGELVVLAGRTSMGKSALAGAIALNVARAGHPVGFVSLEMMGYQIAQRWLSTGVGVSYYRIHRGVIDDYDFQRIFEHADAIAKLPIWMNDLQGVAKTMDAIAADIRRLRRQHNVRLVVIDYLGLVAASGRYRGNRVAEIGEITAGLKALALSQKVCIILIAQLSRALESREDKRPQLHDLRESGAIEQDADVVLLLYREDYYLERAKPKDPGDIEQWQAKLDRVAGLAEVLIGKQRHGPCGTVQLKFDAATAGFSDYSETSSPDQQGGLL